MADLYRSGIKQVILPVWFDLYSFAMMAEYAGVGIWPGKGLAPEWESKPLGEGFMTALKGDKTDSIQEKAVALKEAAAKYPGRDCAAEHVARMAGVALKGDHCLGGCYLIRIARGLDTVNVWVFQAVFIQ